MEESTKIEKGLFAQACEYFGIKEGDIVLNFPSNSKLDPTIFMDMATACNKILVNKYIVESGKDGSINFQFSDLVLIAIGLRQLTKSELKRESMLKCIPSHVIDEILEQMEEFGYIYTEFPSLKIFLDTERIQNNRPYILSRILDEQKQRNFFKK